MLDVVIEGFISVVVLAFVTPRINPDVLLGAGAVMKVSATAVSILLTVELATAAVGGYVILAAAVQPGQSNATEIEVSKPQDALGPYSKPLQSAVHFAPQSAKSDAEDQLVVAAPKALSHWIA